MQRIGTVYKISSAQTPKFYIGSTSNKYISQRLTVHKNDIKRGGGITSKQILCYPDAIITPLCCIKFTNRSELHAIEYQVMKQYGDQVVNHIGIQDSRSSEWRCNNYQKNKDRILARQNTIVNCDLCDKQFSKGNKTRHYKRYHNLYRI